jgi:hypothetical protein
VLVVLVYLHPLRRAFARVIAAETEKASALGETVFGVQTTKSLALEPQRKTLWDARCRGRKVAARVREAGELAAGNRQSDRTVHVHRRESALARKLGHPVWEVRP